MKLQFGGVGPVVTDRTGKNRAAGSNFPAPQTAAYHEGEDGGVAQAFDPSGAWLRQQVLRLFLSQPFADTHALATRALHPYDPGSNLRGQQSIVGSLGSELANCR